MNEKQISIEEITQIIGSLYLEKVINEQKLIKEINFLKQQNKKEDKKS